MASIQDEVECLTIQEKVLLITNDISIIEDPKDQYGIKIKIKDVTIKVGVYPECELESDCFSTGVAVIKE